MLFMILLISTAASCKKQPSNQSLSLPDDFWSCIDGSTATIPLSEALYAHFTGDKEGKATAVKHNLTSFAYQNLLEGQADIIFVTEPSPATLAMFDEAGIKIEVIPVVKEAFVLFVNSKNPVKSLTIEQLQDIYKGNVRNWRELGGDDLSILPYQRNEASGSQTLFISLLMKDEPPAPVPSEFIFADMSSIIDALTYDEWGLAGLGFSVYYYVSSMHDHEEGRIRFLEVDGIMPNNDSIARGDYPLSSYYYAVIRKDAPAGSLVRKLIDFILSDMGQGLMQEAGYVPMRVLKQ
jgi:phosphate transport system substrate-binding protein